MPETIIFGAGGTAGHLFVARGISHYLKNKRVLITDMRGARYICDCNDCHNKGGIKYCPLFDEVHVLPIASANLKRIDLMTISFWNAFKILGNYSDPLFFGCGAYTSLLCGLAAASRNIPIHIYQGDQVVGRANRILQHFSDVSWVSTENLAIKNRRIAGCVARHYINRAPIINDGRFRILIIGSSIGSSLFLDLMPRILSLIPADILRKIDIVHQVRSQDAEKLGREYTMLAVSHTLSDFVDTRSELPRSHLVISRSGWGTISDIVASGRAAMQVPWRNALDDHQLYNAKALCAADPWWILSDDSDPSEVASLLQDIVIDMIETNRGEQYITKGKIMPHYKIKPDGGREIAEYLNAL